MIQVHRNSHLEAEPVVLAFGDRAEDHVVELGVSGLVAGAAVFKIEEGDILDLEVVVSEGDRKPVAAGVLELDVLDVEAKVAERERAVIRAEAPIGVPQTKSASPTMAAKRMLTSCVPEPPPPPVPPVLALSQPKPANARPNKKTVTFFIYLTSPRSSEPVFLAGKDGPQRRPYVFAHLLLH